MTSSFAAFDCVAEAKVTFPTKTDALLAAAALDAGRVDGEQVNYSPALLFDAFVRASLKPTFNMREYSNRKHGKIHAHEITLNLSKETGGSLAGVLLASKDLRAELHEQEGPRFRLLSALIQASLHPLFNPQEIQHKTYGRILAYVSEERFKGLQILSSKSTLSIKIFPEFLFLDIIALLKSIAVSLVMDERDSSSSFILLANDRHTSTLREIMGIAAAMRTVHSSWAAHATKVMGIAALFDRDSSWDGYRALRTTEFGIWTQHVQLHGHWGNEATLVCALLAKTSDIRTLDVSIGVEAHVDALLAVACNLLYLVDILVYFPLCNSSVTDSQVIQYFVAHLSACDGFPALKSIKFVYDGIVDGSGLHSYLSSLLRLESLISVCFRSTSGPRLEGRMFEELVWRRSANETGRSEFALDAGTLSRNAALSFQMQNCLDDIRVLRIPVFYKGVRNVQDVLDKCQRVEIVEFHWCCTSAPDIEYKFPYGIQALIVDFDGYNAFRRSYASADVKKWLDTVSKFVASDKCPISLQKMGIRCRWFADNSDNLVSLKTAFEESVFQRQRDVDGLEAPNKDVSLFWEFLTDSCDENYSKADMKKMYFE